jgi:hypothetical protein
MTVTIRQLQDCPEEYFAYAKSLCGKGTYFAYLSDDIFGAIVLVNFIEMLRSHFEQQTVEVKLLESSIRPKNPMLLDVLRTPEA